MDLENGQIEPGSANARPVALRTQAYENFRQQILDARIRAGQFVSQRELVKLLEMPLAAVRELVPRLEAAGLIKTVPKRGLQVATVDLKLIRNAWQVRAMVEREAVTQFVSNAQPGLVERLIADHQRILERAQSPQLDHKLESDMKRVDWGLHDLMVDSMGNEILSEIYRVNSLHVRLIRFDADALRPIQVVPTMQEHLRFLQAVKDRDLESALEQMMAHIEASKQRVVGVMLSTGS